jgi:hypothetical protein
MTAPVVTMDNRPLVGAYGDAYTAPPGTPPPTDINAPAAPWVKLGLISEDGATWALPTEETTDIGAWQVPYPVRILTVSLTTSIQFSLMEWDRDTLPIALGGGTFVEDLTTVTYVPPAAGESNEVALFLKVLDDPIEMGIYYQRARVSERGDASFKKDEAALLDVTFSIVGEVGKDPYNLIFMLEQMPAATSPGGGGGGSGIPATSALAGSPGSFQPSGSDTPANKAALGTVAAAPPSAWNVDEYVVLGDNSKATWDGDSWETYTTPPEAPTGVTAGTPGAFVPPSAVPANLAALIGYGALGQTASPWTTGQYVVLGDASHASWNGTTWITGPAA